LCGQAPDQLRGDESNRPVGGGRLTEQRPQMPRGGRRWMATNGIPGIRPGGLTHTAVPHGTWCGRKHLAVPGERDGAIVELYDEWMHRRQVSLGKLMLLSADCLGSGTMVGSSRMVADSSGTCGAPGA